MFVKGIDGSTFDDAINWSVVKEQGIRFGYTCATYADFFVNDNFQTFWQGMKEQGILCGAYLFFHPYDDLKAQVIPI